METNRIVTYSLLAHINNNMSNQSIKDLSYIFIPLVKRVISKLYKQGVNEGLIDDLKKEVDSTYSFDMPYPILARIIRIIANESNINQNNSFMFYDDRSFMIKKYIFSEYEDFIDKQNSEIMFLADTYLNYLKAQNLDISSQPLIFEFIDKNRISLSRFFSDKIIPHIDPNYVVQAKFIETIKDNHELYSILKRIYLGSIISSYLEVDHDEIKGKELEFLLDTNFIVSLINLHSEQSHHTCSKVVELCKKFGFKLKVLNITIEETKALLNRTAEGIKNVKIFKQLDTDSIENACNRRKLNKTDLEKITSELEKTLIKTYGIHIISDKNYLENKALSSEVYSKLKNRKINPDGALHDAMALLYVQEKRGKEVLNFDEANCWFVIDSKNEHIKYMKRDGKYSEIIRAEDLVNILWLTNPSVDIEEIADIGLTQLVSITINNSLPNSQVLRELDENIQKYAIEKIEPAACVRLASNVASQTVLNMSNIEELNRLAKKSPADFVSRLIKYSEEADAEQKSRDAATNKLIGGLKTDFEKQLEEKERSMKELYENEIKTSKSAVVEKEKLLLKSNENAMKTKKENYNKLTEIKNSLDKEARILADIKLWILIGVYIIEFIVLIICTFLFGWPIMSPFVSFIGLGSVIGGYIYFALTKKKFNPIAIYEDSIEVIKEKNYMKYKFDIQYYNSLKKEIEEYEARSKK